MAQVSSHLNIEIALNVFGDVNAREGVIVRGSIPHIVESTKEKRRGCVSCRFEIHPVRGGP